jgi:hypothetical protein
MGSDPHGDNKPPPNQPQATSEPTPANLAIVETCWEPIT